MAGTGRASATGAIGSAPSTAAASSGTWLVAILALSTAVRLALAYAIPPLGDEAYHHDMARRLLAGHFDHPPLTFWLAALGGLGTPVLGFMAVRLPFVALFTASTWLVFLITRRLFGPTEGLWAIHLFHLAFYFPLVAGTFALTEGPLVFTWLLGSWCLVAVFFRDRDDRPTARWIAVGAALGLALLAKYHAVFLLSGAGLYLLTVARERRWLRHPGPWLAALMGLAAFLPVLVWNYQHEWISFAYQLGRGTHVKPFQPEAAFLNLMGQSLLVTPWLWVLLVRELVRGLLAGPARPAGWFLSIMGVTPIVLFTAASTWNGQWSMFHWPIVGYVLLFPPLGASVVAWRTRGGSRARSVLAAAGFVSVAGACILIAVGLRPGVLAAPVYMPGGRSAVSNHDVFGFGGLRQALRAKGAACPGNGFIVSGHYMDAGRIAWLLDDDCLVTCLGDPDDVKNYRFIEGGVGWPGANALGISRDRYVQDDLGWWRPLFDRVTPLGTITVGTPPYRTTLHLHLLEQMRSPKP